MELDRISKHVVVKLDQLEEATASELKEAIGLDANQSIHYRMDRKLIPQGLALEHPDRRDQPGSRKAARVYQITDDGAEWVEDHGHEVTLTDIDEAEQEIQRLSAEVRGLSSDIQKLKRWRQEQAGHSGGVSTRLSTLGDRVDDLGEKMDKHERRDYSGIWDQIHDLDERTDRLGARLDEPLATADDIEQVEQAVADLDDRLDTIESNLSDVEATQSDFSDWSHSMDDRVRQLEQRTFLDHLLPWR